MKDILVEWLAKDKNNTMKGLARASGVSYKQIWHYVAGRWKPCEANVKKIMKIVDKSE